MSITADEFRTLALALPEAAEQSHMHHPDFRIRGKIFATLGPDEDWGMVKLTPQQQATFLATERDTFTPAAGAWGQRGATIIRLGDADEAAVEQALIMAWRNTAPKTLVREFDQQ